MKNGDRKSFGKYASAVGGEGMNIYAVLLTSSNYTYSVDWSFLVSIGFTLPFVIAYW